MAQADTAAVQQLLECDPGFNDTVRRHSRFRDPQMQRDVRPFSGKPGVNFYHFGRIRIFQGNAEPREINGFQKFTMIQGALQHG